MARSAGIVVDNNLTGGLITEATGLNYPENACTETVNCVFDPIGKVERREGFDLEEDFLFTYTDKTNRSINQFLWKNVGNTGTKSFNVVQVGLVLRLYEVTGAVSLSTGVRSDVIDLSPYLVVGSVDAAQTEISFSSGLGYLFVTHPSLNSAYISYSQDTDTFSLNPIYQEIRDFEGLNDGIPISGRPTTLSTFHWYNLFNQGWWQSAKGYYGGYDNTINLWRWDGAFARGDYPSNSDVWWFYRGPYVLDPDNALQANPSFFRNALVDTLSIGNTPAPKGHYILPVHVQDRSLQSGIPGIPVQSTGTQRLSTNTFYAGRVFYSGLTQPKYVGKIYFSQIIETNEQFGRCYQQNDPTSEDNSDLLPSDGGVISIAEAGRIVKMIPIGNTLVVWAVNGIWAINGSEGLGFKANDYSVRKISSNQTLSAYNFVDVEGTPIWWNQDGLYTIASTDQLGSMSIQNITEKKIKKFLDVIPINSKVYSKGAYNNQTKTVQWLYRSTEPLTVEERYEFDKVLVFNTTSGAFYPWDISLVGGVTVNGIVVVDGQTSVYSLDNVTTIGGEIVTNNSADSVTVEGTEPSALSPVFKYLISYPIIGFDHFSFAEVRDINFVDWRSFQPTTYPSFFSLGFKVHGEAMRKWQPTYLRCFSENIRRSQFDIQGRWDFSVNADTGRWSSIQRVYSKDLSYGTSSNRVKIRGHGLALQLRIDSVENEPFVIIGFSNFETGNQAP